MTTIDPGQRLATAMRAQLALARERASPKAATAQKAQSAGRATHTVSPAMAQRIAAIAPDDPDRPRKAVRIYLEGELAREFGARLLNEPDFPAMLNAVQERMQEDAETALAAEALGRYLLTGASKPG